MMRSLLVIAALAALPITAAPAQKKAVVRPRAAVAVDWSRTIAATPDGGVRMGSPNAAVKLIEYGSRTCPHCARFDKEGFPVLKTGPIKSGKLSYEFREYPVHGELDLAPILLGNCVPVTRFFPVLDAMFAQQDTLLANVQTVAAKLPQNATAPQVATGFGVGLGYVALLQKFGVTPVRARACLADTVAINRLAARTKVANDRFKIAGTPTFIINGKPVDNVFDWAGLQPALQAAGVAL